MCCCKGGQRMRIKAVEEDTLFLSSRRVTEVNMLFTLSFDKLYHGFKTG